MQVHVVRRTIRREIEAVSRDVYSRPDFFRNACALIVGPQVGPQGHFRAARPAALLAYPRSRDDSRFVYLWFPF